MNTQEKFTKIYSHIVHSGVFQEPPKGPRMDNWAQDTWLLGDIRASLADGGYTRSLSRNGSTAYHTGDFEIQYMRCDSLWIDGIYQELFP
jgi:hypothetical protein